MFIWGVPEFSQQFRNIDKNGFAKINESIVKAKRCRWIKTDFIEIENSRRKLKKSRLSDNFEDENVIGNKQAPEEF